MVEVPIVIFPLTVSAEKVLTVIAVPVAGVHKRLPLIVKSIEGRVLAEANEALDVSDKLP